MQTSRFLLLTLLSLFAVISVASGRLDYSIRIAMTCLLSHIGISCSNPGRYAGQSLCDHQSKWLHSSCVNCIHPVHDSRKILWSMRQLCQVCRSQSLLFVSEISLWSYRICTGDRRRTEQWTRGIRVSLCTDRQWYILTPEIFVQVRGADIPVGTAIATFPNGAYQGHAAIYIGQDKQGIQVWDQVRRATAEVWWWSRCFQFSGVAVSRRTIRWNGARISNNGDSFYVIDWTQTERLFRSPDPIPIRLFRTSFTKGSINYVDEM